MAFFMYTPSNIGRFMKKTLYIPRVLILCALCMATVLMGFNMTYAGGGDPVRGAALYVKCSGCHGLDGGKLAGQAENTLLDKMHAIKAHPSDKPKIQAMYKMFNGMTEQELLDLAAYMTKM